MSSTSQKSCYIYNTETSCKVDTPTITRSGFTIIGLNTTSSSHTTNSSYDKTNNKLTLTSSNSGNTWYAITSKDINVTFAKGSNTASIGDTSGSCTVWNNTTTCQIETPSITPNEGYSVVGWNTALGVSGVMPGNNISVSVADTYYGNSLDNTDPVATISGGATAKQTSQTFELTCTDSAGITGYYFGTTAPTSSTTYTTVVSTQTMNIERNADSAATYYLACKDAAGNTATTNVTVRSYRVYNTLLKLNGTKGTYNTTNYNTEQDVTYYIKDGTSLAPSNVCSTPTGGDSLLGYYLAAPSTTARTLTSASTNIAMSTNRSVGCYYNRKENRDRKSVV